jgi:DNA-binding IclR family transcriptional regulator
VVTIDDSATEGDPVAGTVLGKVVAVLTAFTSHDRSLSFTELVRRTEMSKSTLHRTCASLVEVGMLERHEGRYSLGRLMFELGMRASGERVLLEAATPFLEELRAAVQETVHLGVRDGSDVVYIAKLAGHRRVQAPSSPGGRLALSCTAVGKALLAFAPPEVQREVLAGELERRTPRSVTAPGVLQRQLERVREEGVAYEHEESQAGVVCVGAPVLDAAGFAVAAVSLAGPATRFRPERHAAAVREAARGVAAALELGTRFR